MKELIGDQNVITLLCGSIALHLAMGGFLVCFLRKTRRAQTKGRKIIEELKKINSTLQDTIDLKTQVIKTYRQMYDQS